MLAYEGGDPRDLVRGGDLALGERQDLGIDRLLLVLSERAGRQGECTVDGEAAPVDDLVENPQRLLIVRERGQPMKQSTLKLNVARAVLV